MTSSKDFTMEIMLEAIENSGGIISTVAKRLGCAWHTAQKYIDQWPETKQAYADETETILDMADGELYKLVKNGDLTAIKWLQATKGRARGYITKQEIENTGQIVVQMFESEKNVL